MRKKIFPICVVMLLISTTYFSVVTSGHNDIEVPTQADDKNEKTKIKLLLGPRYPNLIDNKSDQKTNHLEHFLTCEREFTRDEFKIVENELESLKEKVRGKCSDGEIHDVIHELFKILREHSVVPKSFTLENLSETIETFKDKINRFLGINIGNDDFKIFEEINKENSYKLTENNLFSGAELYPLDSFFGVGTIFVSITLFGQGLPLSIPMTIVNESGVEVPLIFPFNFSTEAPMTSLIRSIIRNETWNWTGAGAIGGYKFQFLILPSLLTFSYIFGTLGFGGSRPVCGDDWLNGPLISISGMFGAFTLTIILENVEPGYILQTPILEIGVFGCLGQAIGSLNWVKTDETEV